MRTREQELRRGLVELARAVRRALDPLPGALPATVSGPSTGPSTGAAAAGGWLRSDAYDLGDGRSRRSAGPARGGDTDLAVSSDPDAAEATRLIALVELARGGDADAFGSLFDHYQPSVYRFVYYRVGSAALAEDLTSETFFRALRSMASFRWQGKDFGAWLMTIARNLTTDHFKAGRTRLEYATEDMTAHDEATEGPEDTVLSGLVNEALLRALTELPAEQQECLIMRFLQGLSIAETSRVLGRSEGAVKQLQLRAVRRLAKLLPEGVR